MGSKVCHSVFLLTCTAGNDSNVTAHSNTELNSHGAEATETGNSDLITRLNTVVPHGRVDSDTSAQEWCSRSKGHALAKLQSVVGITNDVSRVATVGRLTVVLAFSAVARAVLVGESTIVSASHAFSAIVLFTILAHVAATARVNENTDTSMVANLEFGDIFADSHHNTSDFVTWDHGEDSGTPLLAGLMDIRVANASVRSLNMNIVITDSTTLDRVRYEGLACLKGSIALSIECTSSLH